MQFLVRAEKQQLYKELKRCLDVVEPIDGKSSDEVVVSMPYLLSKYKIMSLSMIRCLLEYFLGGKGEIGEHKFKKNTVVSVFFRVLIRWWAWWCDGWRHYFKFIITCESKFNCLGLHPSYNSFTTCSYWCILCSPVGRKCSFFLLYWWRAMLPLSRLFMMHLSSGRVLSIRLEKESSKKKR